MTGCSSAAMLKLGIQVELLLNKVKTKMNYVQSIGIEACELTGVELRPKVPST